MRHEVSRRSLLMTGIGAAAGVGALGAAAGAPATASPQATGPVLPSVAAAPANPLTPGLSYALLDGLAFVPDDPSQHPRTSNMGAGYTTSAAWRLVAPLTVPVGSVLREISVAYEAPAPASGAGMLLFRQPFSAPMESVGTVPLPESARTVVTAPLDERVDGSSTYNLQFFVGFTSPTAYLYAVRVGYAAPHQAFVPVTPSVRVLDTRRTGFKLAPGEERVVTLDGMPSFAAAAVVNLTVTETVGAGFVAVYPAASAWPGTSSINWSRAGETVANAVVTAADAAGRVVLRAGADRCHAVLDLIGYLL